MLRRRFRLLLEFHAFQLQQILSAPDGVFQRAMRVIEHRALLQTPFLFLTSGTGIDVGVQLAAQVVKIPIQGGRIDVQLFG